MTSVRIKTQLLEATALRYFREAATAGSIRNAAERIHVAPSAITRQIAKLEDALGTPLLERRARGVVVTQAGAIFLEFSEKSQLRIHEAIGLIDDLTQLRSGSVRIASVEGIVPNFLADCIADFQMKYPNVMVFLSILGSQSVIDAVLAGEVDVGIAFQPPKLKELRPMGELIQPLCAIVRPEHPLGGKRSARTADLFRHSLVLPDASFGIRQLIDRAAAKSGKDLYMTCETNSIEAAKSLVRKGKGLVTVLPSYAIAEDIRNGALCAVPLRDPILASSRAIMLVRRGKKLALAVTALIEEITQKISANTELSEH
ncbi:MAG TPA: LysR family transcriptional regulator [Burkholderiaceae bacterium]|nr:LysR family transcriptional regulator [Burkholderiaceae bacterium]